MGPLQGTRVVEIASIGPGPFAAMLLADMGAEVLRFHRADQPSLLGNHGVDTVGRGRVCSLPVDLKDPDGRALVLRLLEGADAMIEGFRPGVMERLELGPDVALARNPRLVYGRMTGYGQAGPMARVPGHDINYISVAGVLGAFARAGDRPMFPLNLVGDYGGGGMLLAFGIVCAVLQARLSGEGQVVDAAMVDGAALLSTTFHGLLAGGVWSEQPGTNALDSGAPFYEVYRTADGGHIAVGALEPQFYAALLQLLEVSADDAPQWDRERWPALKDRFAAIFVTRTRAEWAELLEPADACATAVLGFGEATQHPHNVARGTFVEHAGIVQPAPAPRFSATPAEIRRDEQAPAAVLRAWGLREDELPPLS